MPFDPISADYLSLLKGKGGYKTVLMIIDTHSSFMWAYKLKTAGTGKTMLDGLWDVVLRFWKPGTTMMDSGSHFNNKEVH